MNLARAHVRVPDHVVQRAFESETVVLNLHTGEYHGLNHTAARMLEALREHGSVPATAEVIAREFQLPVEKVTGDLTDLCADLAFRSLIEIAPGPDV